MARQKKHRLIQRAPHFRGFKPIGIQQKPGNLNIGLDFEEYEAMKLCDYDMLNHATACELMGVSRPTFTRVYESARKKMAKALVEGTAIIFNTGNTELAMEWIRCDTCRVSFSLPANGVKHCPFCKSDN